MTCDFDDCNREHGHKGPHGFEAVPGLIFAPHGGNEGGVSEPIAVPLKCDCCGADMTMRQYDSGGGSFTCQCGQRWNFQPQSVTSTIISRLYPYRMKEQDPLYQEFLDYKLKQAAFYYEASALCGLMTRQEAEHQNADFQRQVTAKRGEIAASKGQWRRLLRWYIGLWERK